MGNNCLKPDKVPRRHVYTPSIATAFFKKQQLMKWHCYMVYQYMYNTENIQSHLNIGSPKTVISKVRHMSRDRAKPGPEVIKLLHAQLTSAWNFNCS